MGQGEADAVASGLGREEGMKIFCSRGGYPSPVSLMEWTPPFALLVFN